VRQRDDGVLLALLRDSATRRTLLAGCTHLFWNPRYPDVKAAQAMLICRAAGAFLRQQGLAAEATLRRDAAAVPTIIAGDFNSLPFKRRTDAFDTGGRPSAWLQRSGCVWYLPLWHGCLPWLGCSSELSWQPARAWPPWQ
jgi:endonuclease/exonuclease/phosphatase family metal-dependent hydrolase